MKPPSKVPASWATNLAVPVGWMRQFRYLSNRFDEIADIDGDIVECGLGEGNTFSMLAYLVGSENRGRKGARKLWGFDSFQGFPQPSRWDESPRKPLKGEWRVTQALIHKRLSDSGIKRGFPQLDIRITKGFLAQSLPNFPKRRIALLHLDVDLYEGYRDGLSYLFPKMAVGGLVLFDEYREFHPRDPAYGKKEKWPGCSRVVDEYFANRPEKPIYDAEAKKYFVVKIGR